VVQVSEKPLRDYQRKAVDSIWANWDRGFNRTLCSIPTGTGKTRIGSEVASMIVNHTHITDTELLDRMKDGQRMLWLCHREELAFQAQKALREATGREVHLEMGDYRASHRKAPIVVAMVQSLVARRKHYKPDAFQYGMIDECFPAGTLVDGRPIESIRSGDYINSFNHSSDTIERRKVLRTSKRRPRSLVRVTLVNGHVFHCTEEHPFFATVDGSHDGRYVAAKYLTTSHFIGKERNDQTSVSASVPVLRLQFPCFNESRNAHEGSDIQCSQERTSILFNGLSENSIETDRGKIDGRHKQEVCQCKNEGQQSYEIAGDKRKGVSCNEGKGAKEQGWKREGDDGSSETADRGSCGRGSRCCGRVCDQHEAEETVPASLQDRYLFADQPSLHRSGRGQSQAACAESTGQKERCVLDWHRVDRVEILEQSGDRTFGGVCRDGFVYNFEVEQNHNYFVDGYLVHNCHHATAKTYVACIDYFTGIRRWLGLTATPKRADGVALGKVFESVAYHMEVGTAVDLGWLVPPRQRIATCRDIDLRNVDTVAGDFNKAQLKAQLMKQQVVDQIARKTIAVADGRQTIVFCQTVDQAHALSRVFTMMGESSVSICGKTLPGIRKSRVEKFRSGSARFLCQVNICTEGFDVPECEVVSMARPTKSQPVFAQAVGRGLRPLLPPQGLTPTERRREIASSTKKHATVLDFYGNTGRHKLCNTGDLLGGEFDDEVRAMAVRKAQETDHDVDMIALLNQCKEEIAKLPKVNRSGAGGETDQDKLYRLYAQALFHFEPHPCDALGIDPKVPEAAIEKDDAYGSSLSRATRCLENHKLRPTEIGKMSNRQIVYCSRVLEDRESRGLATYPQLRALYKHGYPPTLTKSQASMKMAQIKANKGRRPPDDGPNQVLLKLVDRLTVPKR